MNHRAFEIVSNRGKFDVLGQRVRGQTMATVKAPGEPGWLGNPYVADDAGGSYTRQQATEKFAELIEQKAQDPDWREAFLGLEGKRIGYYKPGEEFIHLNALDSWIARERSARAAASGAAPFRLVVAGGRDFADPAFLDQALNRAMASYAPADVLSGLSDASPYGRLQVISGGAAGADTLGEQWAKAAGVPVQRYPAAWDNLDAPGAVIRTNRRGQKYNANAGFDRNRQMAENADAVLVMPGGRGTDHMVRIAQELGLPVWDARSGDLDSLKLLPGAARAMQEVARPAPTAAPAAAPVSPPATEQLSFFDEARRFAGQAWPWMAAAGGSAALALAVAELQSDRPPPSPYPPS